MKLKIIEYNILNGFCTENIPYTFQKTRLDKASKILESENPDIVILCECFFWPFAKKNTLKNIRKTLTKIYDLYAPSDFSFRWAPVILSRYTIKEFKILSRPYLNLLRAKIKINSKIFTLDVFHPNPNTSDKQKALFLEDITKNIKEDYILTGDFNALSPEDIYDSEKLIKGYEKFMYQKGKEKVKDMLKTEAINIVLKNGLKDTFKINGNLSNFTVPTDLRDKEKNSAVRLDYIFCSKNFRIVDSGIIRNKLAEKASDHYPIYAILET